jgi:hypothetical protein
MKLLVLSTSNNILDGRQKRLEDSLIKHGYDYEFFLYGFAFGEQYKTIKIWVDQYQGDATHVLYTDQWDSFAVAPPEEVIKKFKGKMLISTEKAYFPPDGNEGLYPEAPTVYKYVNGGGCMFEIEFFKKLCSEHPFPEKMMDPYWLRDAFLKYDEVKLDYFCEIFQTMSHSNADEWEIGDRIRNKATNSEPIFFHHNGIKDLNEIKWILELL